MSAIRQWVKSTAANSLYYSGIRPALVAAQRWKAGGRRVMVVSYHRVVDDFRRELAQSIPGLLISQKTLRRQLEQAHALGYEFSSLGHALEVLSGRRLSRRDLFVVTFDDAYADVYEWARPVLLQMGVPAILYVPVGLVGTSRRFDHDRLFHLLRLLQGKAALYSQTRIGPWLSLVRSQGQPISAALDALISQNSRATLEHMLKELESLAQNEGPLLPESGQVMNWEQIRSWARSGFDLGAHTVSHAVLHLLSAQDQENEIIASKKQLESQTGREITDFAYCNGWYSKDVIHRLVKAGFRSAVTTEDQPNVLFGDPYRIKRKVLWENFSLAGGKYSKAMTACHLDNLFGALNMTRPVMGEIQTS